jgi:hypothetical protein
MIEKGAGVSQYSDWATGWTTGVRFPAGARIFSLRYHVQTGSGIHLASFEMSIGGSFPGDKAAGT